MAVSAQREDLTSKARIRNAALRLFGLLGEEGTSLRRIAAEADVTVGLVVHHFGTKEGLRDEVDAFVVAQFADSVASAPPSSSTRDLAKSRDRAVAIMLESQPEVVAYVRRAALGLTGADSAVMTRLTQLALDDVRQRRAEGLIAAGISDEHAVIRMLTQQLGRLLLQPMVDAMWEQVGGAGEADKPTLVVRVE